MLFGEHEAPRMIQALSARARARARRARAERRGNTGDAVTKRFHAGSARGRAAYRSPEPRVRVDWRDDDGRRGERRSSRSLARNEGEPFKRVYSLCVLQQASLRASAATKTTTVKPSPRRPGVGRRRFSNEN